MLFSIICRDKENGFELRKQTRPAHLTFLTEHSVQFAGPILSDDESTPIGSIIVIECSDLAEARAIADADPYHQAGLFRHVDVHPFKQVIPGENS
ncbi:MAG: YciI family protein [Pseudomonadota bacterium]|nr:YciI family protein [Pseudomonadota bacterium]